MTSQLSNYRPVSLTSQSVTDIQRYGVNAIVDRLQNHDLIMASEHGLMNVMSREPFSVSR